jgi:hypothetical protein
MNAIGTIPRSTITHGRPDHGVLDRAALALGEALVAWSYRRAGNRRAHRPAVDHEQLVLLRDAHREAQQIALSRDLAKAQSYGLIR